MKSNKEKKVKAARLSILSNTFLIILKVIVGMVTGSVSIISEAIHSFMDLLAACIAFFSVKISANPPDSRHPYGHGKVENVSGIIEALLIFIAAGWIIYEAIIKITEHESIIINSIYWGALVMFISGIINIFVSRRLYKVAKETDSIALEADALHLKTDVYTSLGIAVALLLIWITDWHILDPIIAILVAVFILFESFSLFKRALSPIFDEAWDKKDLSLLEQELNTLNITYHDVKTRKSGSYRFLEFHMTVDPECTVKESHDTCDIIETHLKSVFPRITTTIHVEPRGADDETKETPL